MADRASLLLILSGLVILLWAPGAEAQPTRESWSTGEAPRASLGSPRLAVVKLDSGGAQAERSPDLRSAIAREARRLARSTRLSAQDPQPQAKTEHRGWIARHPILTGTMIGFGAGFLIGYLPGDDGVFDDFDASFNGLVLGGVGAATGAAVGWLVSR